MAASRRTLLIGAAALALAPPAWAQRAIPSAANEARFTDSPFRRLSEAQWRAQLSLPAFAVLREHETERAGTSEHNRERRRGAYVCAGCGLELFRSEWKFNSGTGWPSFYRVIRENIGTREDTSLRETRTEYHCARCLGHQGHVFSDGPEPTGLRYCNNGVALNFAPARA